MRRCTTAGFSSRASAHSARTTSPVAGCCSVAWRSGASATMRWQAHSSSDARVLMQALALRTASSILLLLVAACASLDKDECVTPDRYAIGLEDRAHGPPVQRLRDPRP